MDVRMPVMDGLEATRQILADRRRHRPRVLMLTTFDLDDYVYEALRAGASGFLLKDAPAAELVHAVRVVAGRRRAARPVGDPAADRRVRPPAPAATGRAGRPGRAHPARDRGAAADRPRACPTRRSPRRWWSPSRR